MNSRLAVLRPHGLLVWTAGFVLLAAFGCQTRKAHPEPVGSVAAKPTPPVRLSVPEKIRFTPEVLATGTLKPGQSAQLAMPVPGTLARVLVRRGQEVKSGAPLAVLDTAGVRASLNQAEASIQAAQAQLRLAEDTLSRMTVMREREAIAEAQFVQVKGQRDLAAAQLQAAVAGRDQARVLLRNHTLVAPFSGVIIRAPDGTGMPVGPQAPLFVIEDLRTLVLETSVTQEEAAELPPHATVTVSVPATGVRVDNATVRLIVPSVDPATNRVPIEIAVPNPEGRLLPHAAARATLPSAGARDAYRVHHSALTQQNGAFSLWLARPDGKAQAIRVRVLAQLDDDMAVVDPGQPGLPAEARVLDSPPAGIAEGARLESGSAGESWR